MQIQIASTLLFFGFLAQGAPKLVAITMDDLPGWSNEPVPRKESLAKIAGIFKREKVPSTGFVIGRLASQSNENRAALKIWAEAGLPLANHSWTHTRYDDLSKEEFISELRKTEEFLEPYRKKYGPWPKAFRFPMLNQGKTTEKEKAANEYLESTGTLLAHVSIDTSDWAFAQSYNQFLTVKSPSQQKKLQALYFEHLFDCVSFAEESSEKVFSRQIPQILLIHANSLNASMLEKIIDGFKKKGYRFISFAEAMEDPAYEPYRYKIAYQPADHFFSHIAHLKGIKLSSPDRSSYQYFQSYWEPKIKAF